MADPNLTPEWLETLATVRALTTTSAAELEQQGFTVIPDAVPTARITHLADAYDAAVRSAMNEDRRVGSATTRVTDFVNRGQEFDEIYLFPPLLDACCRTIGRPFKLSSFHSRTLRPRMPAQDLHVDVPWGTSDWPLVAFILMVDAFRPDNGVTRFVPGSHRWSHPPEQSVADLRADCDGQVLACGERGSLLIFNGSVWHGHTANVSDQPRRSLQGAFIPSAGGRATDFAGRMSTATRARLAPLACQLLGIRP